MESTKEEKVEHISAESPRVAGRKKVACPVIQREERDWRALREPKRKGRMSAGTHRGQGSRHSVKEEKIKEGKNLRRGDGQAKINC